MIDGPTLIFSSGTSRMPSKDTIRVGSWYWVNVGTYSSAYMTKRACTVARSKAPSDSSAKCMV